MRQNGKVNAKGKCTNGQTTSTRNIYHGNTNRTSTRISQAYPKKSAYFSNTFKSSTVGKTNANNSSRQSPLAKAIQTTRPADSSVAKGQVSKKVGDKGKSNSSKKHPSPRKDSLFVTPPRNFSAIDADVIRADCMNHGYRIEKVIGEGAYAKVKLAEVLQSKLARNPSMAEQADYDGNLKVNFVFNMTRLIQLFCVLITCRVHCIQYKLLINILNISHPFI